MDYEKKYKEALEKARIWQSHLYDTNDKDYADELNYIFPELAESEDERIRKQILSFLKEFEHDHYRSLDFSTWTAWLEKQGEQNLIMANLPQLGEKKTAKNIVEIWKDMRLEVYQQVSGNRHEPNYSDDSTKMFSLNDIDEIIEKMSEQKLDDKIELRFHEGEWIVFNGLTLYIKEVVKGYYRTISFDGINNSYDWDIDNIARLWTIQDAKDGDVLVFDDIIMIFKNIKTACTANTYILYCDGIVVNDWCDFGHNATPATKEQRDLLFQKMKEAGYTFDFKNKELKKTDTYCQENCKGFQEMGKCFADGNCKAKREAESTNKVEQHSINEIEIPFGAKDSELQEATYYIPKGFHAEIDDDKVVIKKGEKPAAWSKKDEKMFEYALHMIEWYSGKNEDKSRFVSDWLKSLEDRVQPKQEWSAEDNSVLKDIKVAVASY